MPEPVLIVHGVANHEPAPFLANVADLQAKLDARAPEAWRLVPVFWGDLGGRSVDIDDCLPVLGDDGWTVRAEDDALPLPTPLRAKPGEPRLTNAERAALAAGGTAEGAETVRGTPDRAARIAAALEGTRVLQYVDDPQVFVDLGKALAPGADDGLPPGVETFDTRGGLGDAIGRAGKGVDDLLGRMLGDRMGVANQRLRGAIAAPFSLFFGDIFVYQAAKDTIQARIWETIARECPGYGTPERPINAVAHSLGGLVVFDAAVRPAGDARRLSLRSFTTFGSQAAFFHIIDPRPTLAPYAHDRKVLLPETIPRWTNLWDTLDFLAFTTGTVFRLGAGEPLDVPVQDPLSLLVAEKGWAHSIYWKTEELVDALVRTLV